MNHKHISLPNEHTIDKQNKKRIHDTILLKQIQSQQALQQIKHEPHFTQFCTKPTKEEPTLADANPVA